MPAPRSQTRAPSRAHGARAARLRALWFVAALAGAIAACEPETPPGSDAGSGGVGGGGAQMLPAVSDFGRPGPFPARMIEGTGPDGQYTMFRPTDLNQNGFLFSPLTWGNGILTYPAIYEEFLTNVASHGFVVIASDSLAVDDSLMRAGLDWLIAQNSGSGELRGKLDIGRAVSMGYSIGGTAAMLVGAHPGVITTVSIHGHTASAALHGPLLQTTGTEDSVGVPLQQQTYDQSRVQTFLATLQGATHFEILDANGGREGAPIIAWLRLWVYHDQNARRFFYGDSCTLCVAPWTNPQRKNWQ
jgi:hypothetical protein